MTDTVTELLQTFRTQRDTLLAAMDKMPDDGKYVIALEDGSVLHSNGGIGNNGMLVPIVPGGGYQRWETEEQARVALTHVKTLNPNNWALQGADICTEGHAAERNLWRTNDLLDKLSEHGNERSR